MVVSTADDVVEKASIWLRLVRGTPDKNGNQKDEIRP